MNDFELLYSCSFLNPIRITEIKGLPVSKDMPLSKRQIRKILRKGKKWQKIKIKLK